MLTNADLTCSVDLSCVAIVSDRCDVSPLPARHRTHLRPFLRHIPFRALLVAVLRNLGREMHDLVLHFDRLMISYVEFHRLWIELLYTSNRRSS